MFVRLSCLTNEPRTDYIYTNSIEILYKRNYRTLRLQLELISMSRPACNALPPVDVHVPNSILQVR